MKPSKNDETDLDSEAARRALDYYLNPNPPRPTLENKIWTLHEGVTSEQAQEHAIALLRCAAATAQETAFEVIATKRGENAGYVSSHSINGLEMQNSNRVHGDGVKYKS